MALRNISIFNHLFPDAAYRVVGYSRDDDDRFRIVVEQPFVFGREYSFEDYLHLGIEDRVIGMFAEMGMFPVEETPRSLQMKNTMLGIFTMGISLSRKTGN